jgi:Flp pilus assembly protein CpaB
LNRFTQLLLGFLAILLAIGAGLYGRSRYLKEVSTYPVPVPIQSIPPYTVLSADQFQLREMLRSMESLAYFQSVPDLEGKISTMPIPANLPVPRQSAVLVSEFRLADPADEVISIPVEPVSAVGGQIRIGERINLYRILDQTGNPSNTEKLNFSPGGFSIDPIARDILVVDVRTSQGIAAEASQQVETDTTFGSHSQTEQVQILTLAVKPELVEPILETVAREKKQGGLLWTTLAIP